MSDAPQGPGWWQASDDKWYPPPRPEMPGEQAAASPIAGTPSGGYEQAPPPTTPYGAPVAGPPGTPSGPGMPGAPGAPYGSQPSPYGGVPPITPPPGAGQNRTPLFVALGVLAAVVFVGIIIIATSGGDDDEPTTDPTSPTTAIDDTVPVPTTGGDDPPDTEAPTGDGQIAIGEQGFSVSMDQLSDAETGSYGVMLENTSDQVATLVTVQVGFLDESGTVIGTDSQMINVLMPGQTFGIGNSGIELDGDPVEMQVTPEEPTWDSPDDYGEVTTSGLSTTIDDYGAPTTNFTAESTYSEQLDSPYAYVVYRNSGGDIIGGAWSSMSFIQANGSSTGEVTSYYTIDDIDDSQTEVYIDPGYLG